MAFGDSFSESLPIETMLRTVREVAQGAPCRLNVQGFTLRLYPNRIPGAVHEQRLKLFSTFLLRLSRAMKASEAGGDIVIAFQRSGPEWYVGISADSREVAWMPCEIVSYDPSRVNEATTLEFDGMVLGQNGQPLRRIVL